MRKYIKILICMAAFLFLFRAWDRLLKPETSILDGRNENSAMNYQGFQDLPDHSLDYLVLGSSNAFMNINPVLIWDEYKKAGYDFTSPHQPMSLSEFYLKEALKTQHPQVCFLEVLGFACYDNTTEEFTHLGLDYFPLSLSKLQVISELPFEKMSFIFPFWLYHSRWTELYKRDFELLKYQKDQNFLGYTPAMFSVPCGTTLLADEGTEVAISENNLHYLEKIYDLCKENDITLVLVKTPNVTWTRAMSDAVRNAAKKYKIDFIEFNELTGETDLDLQTDFCDGGSHLNTYGAAKISRYLGENVLKEKTDSAAGGTAGAYFDECVSNLKHYEEVYAIKNENDIDKLMNEVQKPGYVVMISGKNTDSTEKATDYLNKFVPRSIRKNTYAVMIEDGNVHFVQKKKKSIIERNSNGKSFYIESVRTGTKPIDSCIQIDYRNYSPDGEVNFVIYDEKYEAVIDRFSLIENEGDLYIERNAVE